MAITLADVQGVNVDPDINYFTIDELRQGSPYLLNLLQFDNIVTPGTAGGTLTSGYTRISHTRPAHTRQENTEYPAFEAKKRRVTVDLIPIGARYNIDRIHARLGAVSEVSFQQGEAVRATVAKFNDLFINGVAGRDFSDASPEFEGIDAIVTGTITESDNNGNPWDYSNITSKDQAIAASLKLRQWLRRFDATPDVFFVNEDGAQFLDTINSWLGYEQTTQDQFGRDVPTYRGIPYVDLGGRGGTVDENAVLTGAATEGNVIDTDDNGNTSIYGVRFGLDSVHGISTTGALFDQWLPNFDDAGAVKPGEVELGPVAIAAKRTRGAGAFRVKVAA